MRAEIVLNGMVMRLLSSTVVCLTMLVILSGQAFATPTVSDTDSDWSDAELEAEFDEEFDLEPASFPDPLEPVNRVTLGFNRGVDRWLLRPISNVYRFVVPQPARQSVIRFVTNLNSPVVFTNDMLQREWYDAGMTVGRFGINSTVGVLGLFDPADAWWGLEGHVSDFGQTLALEGVPSGAYIVMPLLGPTTVRDGFGDIVDVLFSPLTFLVGPVDQIMLTSIYGTGSGLALWDAHADEIDMLEESSVDFYAALRNAYYQTRTSAIWDRRSDHSAITAVAMEYMPRWSAEPELRASAE